MREGKCLPVSHCFTWLVGFFLLQLLTSCFGRLSSQNIFYLGLEDARRRTYTNVTHYFKTFCNASSSWNLDTTINCIWKLICLLNWPCACLFNLDRVVSPLLENGNSKNSQMGISPLSNLIAVVLTNNIILALDYTDERWVILSARKPQVHSVFSWTKKYYTWTIPSSFASNKISAPPL